MTLVLELELTIPTILICRSPFCAEYSPVHTARLRVVLRYEVILNTLTYAMGTAAVTLDMYPAKAIKTVASAGLTLTPTTVSVIVTLAINSAPAPRTPAALRPPWTLRVLPLALVQTIRR